MSMAQLVVTAVVVEALSKSERDTPPFRPPLPGNAATEPRTGTASTPSVGAEPVRHRRRSGTRCPEVGVDPEPELVDEAPLGERVGDPGDGALDVSTQEVREARDAVDHGGRPAADRAELLPARRSRSSSAATMRLAHAVELGRASDEWQAHRADGREPGRLPSGQRAERGRGGRVARDR
jgi:hypothetical protein